jgi:hypothetical protein
MGLTEGRTRGTRCTPCKNPVCGGTCYYQYYYVCAINIHVRNGRFQYSNVYSHGKESESQPAIMSTHLQTRTAVAGVSSTVAIRILKTDDREVKHTPGTSGQSQSYGAHEVILKTLTKYLKYTHKGIYTFMWWYITKYSVLSPDI